MKRIKIISPALLTLYLLISTSVHAQVANQHLISSAGSSYQANGFQMDFSVGQLINTTASVTNIIVTQGFHQSFSEIVEALEVADEEFHISTFPNPARNFLTIQSESDITIFYTLYDLNGAKLASGAFNTSITIDVQPLAKGSYQLFLTNSREELVQTSKILLK
ncbi:T9SS type A sorting domain-containing protein [Ekhidna sp.]|uniref:T9SS type A sorting domain-containing protein n=1 Tax=Ekhidna sp. TaxID=2608089 RepID=UPI003CCBA691